jgi:predicted dinucleotide-binding enzyme
MSKERRYQNEEIREILELAGRDDVAQPESAPTADGLPKYILQQRWRAFVSSALFAAGALGSRHIAGPIAAAERLNSPSANCNLGILMKAACLLLAVVGMALNSAPALSQDKPAVAMIGTGTLAETLGPALGARGYPVIYGSRDPSRESVRTLVARSGSGASAVAQREAAAQARIVILAVPGEVVEEVASNLGDLDGKIVIDVSGGAKRVASDGYLELTSDSTRAERIQSRHLNMRVVRINLPSIIFFQVPLLLGTPPTVLIAGNDPTAREVAAHIVFDLGVDPWDAGPLRFSRVFDAMNVMSLIPGQQGRAEGYEFKLMPSAPLSCFVDVTELFGFGKPRELNELPQFPRRDPVISCEEWRRRLGMDPSRPARQAARKRSAA